MRRWRRRTPLPSPATDAPAGGTRATLPAVRTERVVMVIAAHAQQLAERVDRLERRLEDVEDTAGAALAPDRLDHLVDRVDELSMTTATHDDVLDARLHSARVAAELTRVASSLRADIDRVAVVETGGLAERLHQLEELGEAILELLDERFAESA